LASGACRLFDRAERTSATSGPTLAQPNPALQAAPLTPAAGPADRRGAGDDRCHGLPRSGRRRAPQPKERSEAASAQFNALQFGRPGAPRAWQGDRGANGQVLVGPPVNVNSLYCRDFTHSVTAGGQSYSKKGMACRELDGSWGVVSAS
jgi:hypothetical protein